MAKRPKFKQKLRVIFYKYFDSSDDDDLGEAQAFFEVVDGNLTLISCWSLNDADYREEYMSKVFRYLGVDVKRLPEKWYSQAVEAVKEAWGI
jgi:hypothetical protein